MAKKFRYDVVHRWEGNPLITIDDIPFPCNTVFNAACAKYNNQYILLLPGSILTLGAGILFGVVKGSIVVSIASTLGAVCAFLVGRYMARGWIANKNDGTWAAGITATCIMFKKLKDAAMGLKVAVLRKTVYDRGCV